MLALAACGGSSGSGSGSPTPTQVTSTPSHSVFASISASARASASAAASSASAAASSFEASVSAQTKQAADAAKAELAKVSGAGNATGDIQLTGVPKAQTGGLHAVVVNITNHSGSEADYAVKVEFRDPSGAVVDSDVVGAQKVAAGGRAQPVAFSTKDEGKTLTARVAQAQRY
ncbi:hypothetical protein [Phaeacidiphilus oryzae]|uniref:hypothetical protein n=1 Tax=Phaeacidiphilus oryzae TaxID=348818 RepID=UPI000ADE20A3|nr:hypothetical protein [Phaeacidiphilus oryzae]